MSDDPDGLQPVTVAAATGDELKLLYALRDRLAEAIDSCPVRDLSSLTRRLQDVMKEINGREEIQKKKEGESASTTAGKKWSAADEL